MQWHAYTNVLILSKLGQYYSLELSSGKWYWWINTVNFSWL